MLACYKTRLAHRPENQGRNVGPADRTCVHNLNHVQKINVLTDYNLLLKCRAAVSNYSRRGRLVLIDQLPVQQINFLLSFIITKSKSRSGPCFSNDLDVKKSYASGRIRNIEIEHVNNNRRESNI